MIHYSYFSWPFLAGSSCKIPFETWPWSYQNIWLHNFYFINKMHAFFKKKAWIILPTFLFKLNTSNININCICKCKLSLLLWSLCSPFLLSSLSFPLPHTYLPLAPSSPGAEILQKAQWVSNIPPSTNFQKMNSEILKNTYNKGCY